MTTSVSVKVTETVSTLTVYNFHNMDTKLYVDFILHLIVPQCS